jgi:ATP adenylyltransferase/5',5'''-P-1,P-4-tetraphosphate phosphorylase II
MIPRKKEKAFNDLSVNAIGFMGSVLFKDPNLLRKYIS